MNRLLTLRRATTASPVAIGALVIANAVPLLGVLAFGWDLATLVAIYWAENGVVGIYAVGRIITADRAAPAAFATTGSGAGGASPDGARIVPPPSTRYGTAVPPGPPAPPDPMAQPMPASVRLLVGTGPMKAFLVPFFCVHYGIFWLVHGIFVWTALPVMFAVTGDGPVTAPDARVVLVATLVMVVSHGVSFIVNWILGGEHLTSSASAEMGAPYARVVILHLTIIFGAFAVAILGQPIGALVVMVVLKTGVDLAAHLGERARAAGRARQAGLAPAG